MGVNGLECARGKLYSLDKEGLKVYEGAGYTPTLINSTVTGGDGLVILDDSTFVASRWSGEVYLVNGSEATLLLDTKAEKSNTADIGYIQDEQLVIVPTFMKNEVAAYRSEEHTSELQSLMRSSYAVFCLNNKTNELNNPLSIS